MPPDPSPTLVVAVSSRALFDLEEENALFEQSGTLAYEAHQVGHEHEALNPGPGFPLVRALLRLNGPDRRVEVVIVSRNNPAVATRIMNSAEHYSLDVSRAVFTSGTPVSRYLNGFGVTLFLSRNVEDVREALAAGTAAGLLYAFPGDPLEDMAGIRVAFDGDAVVFSDEAERIYREQGLEAFVRHERENARRPLPEGPFAPLLKALSMLQRNTDAAKIPIRLAMMTARAGSAHQRVIHTLRSWDVRIDEIFFLGGSPKDRILQAFQPHIFFDDQAANCGPASRVVPTAEVPCNSNRENDG